MARTGRPRKEVPADRPFKGRPLNMWIRDRETFDLLDLLKRKWYNEGKIEDTYSAVLFYMVRNFGEIAKSPPKNNSSLPLDVQRRRKIEYIAHVIATAKGLKDVSDFDVVVFAVDYLYPIFGDEVFLDHFLKAKGELKHGG